MPSGIVYVRPLGLAPSLSMLVSSAVFAVLDIETCNSNGPKINISRYPLTINIAEQIISKDHQDFVPINDKSYVKPPKHVRYRRGKTINSM